MKAWMISRRNWLAVITAFAVLVIAWPGAVGMAGGDEDQEGRFLRMTEEPGRRIALDVAVREYARSGDEGPDVALVAIAHVGEASLYEKIQAILDEYDVVLYESVLPPGAAGPSGETEAERIESTKTSLALLAGMVELYHEAQQTYPHSLDDLSAMFSEVDARLVTWVDSTSRDAWGRDVVYRIEHDDETGEVTGYTVYSRGPANRSPEDAEPQRLKPDEPLDLSGLTDPDGLQAQLAQALGMEFQLTAMSYGRPNWRVSDLALDQVEREMQRRGADFDAFAGGLAGTTFASQVVRVLLRMVEAADSMMDGAIADAVKVAMIELLSDEAMTSQALDQMGEGFVEVIIDERNKVAIDDLSGIIDNEPEVERVAIFYGAAHMPDFVNRLVEMGYTREIDSQWITAMEVDLENTAVPPRQLQQMRQMIRHSLEQQFR